VTTAERDLDWPGTWNARDLGGLPTIDGRTTRHGAVVRSDYLRHLTQEGWRALLDHGVRTVVDLRTKAEADREPQDLPGDVDLVAARIEDGLDEDSEFRSWAESGLLGTPLYYRRFLERWPERCVQAVMSVASARPGGVLIHCSKGCDRTGMLVMFLVVLCDVTQDAIVADYARTGERLLLPAARSLGRVDDQAAIEAVARREGCSDVQVAMRRALRETDVVGGLQCGGLQQDTVAAIRGRLRA
jgi:protein-tyrosine phosphatase